MDLFEHRVRKERVGQPLAERMRPESLEEYVGQSHLLGPDKLLGRISTFLYPSPASILDVRKGEPCSTSLCCAS